MAATNRDWPRGFWPAKTKHGGPPQVSRYYTSADDTLYRGDLVIIASTATQGNVRRLGANTDGDIIVGVCQSFTTYGSGGASDGAVGAEVMVYDDLENTIFIAQCNSSATTALTNFAALKPWSFWGVATGSPTTASEISTMEIATSVTLADGFIRILDRVAEPSNQYGEGYLDVYCMITKQHFSRTMSTLAVTS